MSVIYGTVKQNMIQLPEGVALLDGTQVEIRPRQPERDSQQEKEAEMHFKEHLLKLGVLSSIAKRSSIIQEGVAASPNSAVASENDFKQKLLEAGLLTSIKPAVSPGWKSHKPIVIPGKPLSEIIIEERR